MLKSSKLVITRHVERTAEHLLKKTPFLTSTARWKLHYFIIKKHQRNWLVGNPVQTQLGEALAGLEERRVVQKMTDDYIACLVSFSPSPLFLPFFVVSVFNRITSETGYCRYIVLFLILLLYV